MLLLLHRTVLPLHYGLVRWIGRLFAEVSNPKDRITI